MNSYKRSPQFASGRETPIEHAPLPWAIIDAHERMRDIADEEEPEDDDAVESDREDVDTTTSDKTDGR